MVLGDHGCHFTQRTLRIECKVSDSNFVPSDSLTAANFTW